MDPVLVGVVLPRRDFRSFQVVRIVTELTCLRLLFRGWSRVAAEPQSPGAGGLPTTTEAEFIYRFNAWRKTQVRRSVMECIQACEARLSQGKKMPWETGKGK